MMVARTAADATVTRRLPPIPSLLLLAGLGLFLLSGTAAVVGLHHLIGLADQRASALRSNTVAVELLSAVKDIETGLRGYVIAGSEEFLTSVDAGVARVPALFDQLEAYSARTTLIQPHLPTLRRLAETRIAIATSVIAVRRDDGQAQAAALIASGAGQRAMTAFRSAVKALTDDLDAHVAQLDAALHDVSEQARLRIIISTLIGSASLVGGILVLRIEQGRRSRAEADLEAANADLEARIARRTSQLERANRLMEQHAVNLNRSVESERRRLAREVHDQLGQLFTALKLSLPPSDAVISPMQRALLIDLVDEGVTTARRIASDLRPAVLDDFGLGMALSQRARRFSEETGLACSVDVTDGLHLSTEQVTQLYRIACEAMTNVARHAGAKRLRIDGRQSADGYRLTVEDDGRGPLEGGMVESFGFQSMRERANLAGGTLTTGTSEWGGLRVSTDIPNPSRRHADAPAAG